MPTVDLLIAFNKTATPEPRSEARSISTSEATASSGLPTGMPTTMDSATSPDAAMTATPVVLAQRNANSVGEKVNLATRRPTPDLSPVNVTPALAATTETGSGPSTLPVGYVVVGCAILGLVIYLASGRRDS